MSKLLSPELANRFQPGRGVVRAACGLVGVLLAAGCVPPAQEPHGSVAAAPDPVAFPTTPPEPGPAPSLSLPTPERRTLPNGLQVLYVRHGTLPIVHATLVTRGGISDDPAGLTGMAAFAAAMLDEGAAGRGALQLSDEMARLGARLTTNVGWDAAYVDLHVLPNRLPEALRLMADVAIRPDFPQAELERMREEELTELARGGDEPRVIAANAFASLVYGAEHPYGRITGTEAVRRIDREALREFHGSFYRPGASTLILVGDVDADGLHQTVQQAFGGWSGAATSPPAAVTATPETAGTTLFLIDKPGAAQSEVRIGHPGVARDHPDHFPLLVLNTILGGSFTSRLNTNLRETHGFTYGARSSFAMLREAGPFTASAAVITAKTDSAVAEFFRELNRIRDEPVSAAELERAKSYVALGLPRRFETTQAVASQLADLTTYGLSMDFFNDYVLEVMEVTAADVQRVAREHVRPDRSVVVIVGDLQAIEPGLRALGLPIDIRSTGEFIR